MTAQITPNFARFYPQPGGEIQGYSGYRNIMSAQAKPEPNSFNWNIVNEFDPEKLKKRSKPEQIDNIVSEFLHAKFSIVDMQIIQNPIVFKLLQILQVVVENLVRSKETVDKGANEYIKSNKELEKQMIKKNTKIQLLKDSLTKYKYAERCPTCQKLFGSSIALDKHIYKSHSQLSQSWRSMRTGNVPLIIDPNDDFQDEINELRRMVRAQNDIIETSMKKTKKRERPETMPAPIIGVPISPFNPDLLLTGKSEKQDNESESEEEKVTRNVEPQHDQQILVSIETQTDKEPVKKKLSKAPLSVRQNAKQFLERTNRNYTSDVDERINIIREHVAETIHKQSQVLKLHAKKKLKDELKTHIVDESITGVKKPITIDPALLAINKGTIFDAEDDAISISGNSSLGDYSSVTFVPEDGFVLHDDGKEKKDSNNKPDVGKESSESSSSSSKSKKSKSGEKKDESSGEKQEEKKPEDVKDNEKESKKQDDDKNSIDDILEIPSIDGSELTNETSSKQQKEPTTPKKDLRGVQISSDLESLLSSSTTKPSTSTTAKNIKVSKGSEGSDF